MQRLLTEFTVDWFDWIPDYYCTHQAVFIEVWPDFLTYSRSKTDQYTRFHWAPASVWYCGRYVDWRKWL